MKPPIILSMCLKLVYLFIFLTKYRCQNVEGEVAIIPIQIGSFTAFGRKTRKYLLSPSHYRAEKNWSCFLRGQSSLGVSMRIKLPSPKADFMPHLSNAAQCLSNVACQVLIYHLDLDVWDSSVIYVSFGKELVSCRAPVSHADGAIP